MEPAYTLIDRAGGGEERMEPAYTLMNRADRDEERMEHELDMYEWNICISKIYARYNLYSV